MRRKIIAQGRKAYTVTLPIGWVRENTLSAGEEVELHYDGNRLIVSTEKEPVQKKKIVLRPQKDTLELLRAMLIETYTFGYDQVEIISNSRYTKNHIENVLSHYFLGFELTHQREGKYLVENVSEPDQKQFDNLKRKMFFICSDALQQIIDHSDNLKKVEVSIREQLDRMEKYNNFCMRTIIKKIIKLEAEPAEWLILSLTTKLKRTFIYFLDSCLKRKIQLNVEQKKILYELQAELNSLYQLVYKTNVEEVYAIYERNKILQEKIITLEPKGRQGRAAQYYIVELNRIINYLTGPIIALIINNNLSLKAYK